MGRGAYDTTGVPSDHPIHVLSKLSQHSLRTGTYPCTNLLNEVIQMPLTTDHYTAPTFDLPPLAPQETTRDRPSGHSQSFRDSLNSRTRSTQILASGKRNKTNSFSNVLTTMYHMTEFLLHPRKPHCASTSALTLVSWQRVEDFR